MGLPPYDVFSTEYLRRFQMAGEQNAGIETFVATVIVQHPRLGKVKMNFNDYDAAKHGPILSGPTQPARRKGVADPANKDPRIDDDERVIAEQASTMHRA